MKAVILSTSAKIIIQVTDNARRCDVIILQVINCQLMGIIRSERSRGDTSDVFVEPVIKARACIPTNEQRYTCILTSLIVIAPAQTSRADRTLEKLKSIFVFNWNFFLTFLYIYNLYYFFIMNNLL